MNSISVGSAFLAGMISFLSPCVLPLVPAYLSFIAGISFEEMKHPLPRGRTRHIVFSAVIFVLGFSTVFILLGASASWLGSWLIQSAEWLGKIAGGLLILLGIHLIGLIRIPFLFYEKKIQVKSQVGNYFNVFLIGAAFAFGWSPCVGPLLAGILALASTHETIYQGMLLLAVYSAGLGIPFILASIGVGQFVNWLQYFRKYLRWVEMLAGFLLISIGGAMIFGQMPRISSWFALTGRLGL